MNLSAVVCVSETTEPLTHMCMDLSRILLRWKMQFTEPSPLTHVRKSTPRRPKWSMPALRAQPRHYEVAGSDQSILSDDDASSDVPKIYDGKRMIGNSDKRVLLMNAVQTCRASW